MLETFDVLFCLIFNFRAMSQRPVFSAVGLAMSVLAASVLTFCCTLAGLAVGIIQACRNCLKGIIGLQIHPLRLSPLPAFVCCE